MITINCDHCKKEITGSYINFNPQRSEDEHKHFHYHYKCFVLSENVPPKEKLGALKNFPKHFNFLQKEMAPYLLMDL